MFPRRACRRRPDGETFAQRGNILGHGPDGETFGESHLPPRRGNIVVQNVSPSVLTPRRGNIFYLWPRRGNILGQIAQNGKEMFPRRGDTCQDRQECFPVGAVANVSPSGLPATGKHFPQARRGNISAPPRRGNIYFHRPDGETFARARRGNMSGGGRRKPRMFPRRGCGHFPEMVLSATPTGKHFPAIAPPATPTGKHFPTMTPSATPTGKHVRKCFPVGVTPRRGNISDLATGKHL